MFSQGSAFKLIEQSQEFEAKDFVCSTDIAQTNYIELSISNDKPNQTIVASMFQAIVDGTAADVPVIFNRTGQSIEHELIPSKFCIGLFTSGTTGLPTLVFHSLQDLMPTNRKKNENCSCWLLCYHPMSYAGLQVILQAVAANDTLVADVSADIKQKASLAIEHQITAISATPSFIRALLLCWHEAMPVLELITLGGEIADQATLNAVKQSFPDAAIRHIYATTEAGVVFSVKDGNAGFPKHWLDKSFNGWQLQGKDTLILVNQARQIDTGDCIDITHDRVVFTGRKDNIVNVGGVKVNLEDIEQQIINLEEVSDARVFVKANPITGALVCAEICALNEDLAKQTIRNLCQNLVPAARPRIVTYCEQLTLTQAGKKQRCLQ